jgi:hypothetical protein
MKAGAKRRLLVFFFVGGHGLEIFRFEDLAAIQTLHVIDAVTPGNYLSTVMVTHTN